MFRHLSIALSVLFCLVLISCGKTNSANTGTQEVITLTGAWALYPMAITWGGEYNKINPNVRIEINAGGAGKGMVDVLAGIVDIGMLSRSIYPQETEKGAFAVAVTKDAVVPVVNSKNPHIRGILDHGASRQELIDLWITGKTKVWKAISGDGGDEAVHMYTRSDACGAGQTWAEYLGKNQEDLTGTAVYGDPGLAEAVRKDVLGIGYNNVNYAFDAKTRLPVDGLMILPIDLNDNNTIDNDERFYNTRDTLLNAIKQNKYPSPPARDLFFVCKGKPGRGAVISFIRWILTKGQAFAADTGYIPLDKKQLEKELQRIK